MKVEDVWRDWQIEKKIGRGSYGTVYKCFKEENGERVYSAIKVISVPGDDVELQSSGSLERMTVEQSKAFYKEIIDSFMQEISILESLKGHPNIVRIDEFKMIEDEHVGWHLFIRMELLTDFNTYSCDRTFTEKDVIKMATDLGNALKACAEKNIVHRDIKPENIFVDENGTFKLGDFGVAKQLERTETAMSRKGTYNYMAPEVLNAQKGDSRADIYSLGIVMYQLLNNNRLPFLDPNKQFITHSERDKAFKRRTIDGEKLPELPNVSPELNAIIARATQFKKEDRFKSIDEFNSAISVLSNKGKSAKVRAMKWSRKRKVGIGFLLTLLVLVIGVGTFAVLNPEVISSIFSLSEQPIHATANDKTQMENQIENSGHVEAVFSANGMDYYATHDGFFKNDGKETIQLTDQPCIADFSILHDKIFYGVIDKNYEEVLEIGDDKVTVNTAQCSCWVMDLDGNDQTELFKYKGSGYVVSIINDSIYYLDDKRDVNIMAGNGRTLFVRSLLDPDKKPTAIHEEVQDTLSVRDQYLFFNEYSSDDTYATLPSYRYDYSKHEAKEMSCHVCAFSILNVIDDNTLLLFCEREINDGDGSWSPYKYLGKYSIATDSIKEIREGYCEIVDAIDENTLGLSLESGYYLFNKESEEMKLLTNETGYSSRFLNSETVLFLSGDDEKTTFEKVSSDTKSTADFNCTSWSTCLGKNIAVYWKEENSEYNFDNCASYDGVIQLEDLNWTNSESTLLVTAPEAMLYAPIVAYARRTDYHNYKYINVRYGPSVKHGLIDKIDDYSPVQRLSEKVDGWYLCDVGSAIGWIDADYVFDGDLENGGSDFEFDVEYGEVHITGYTGKDNDLYIPSRISNWNVTSIENYAFEKSTFKSVEIPESITNIGENAFSGCKQLKKATIKSDIDTVSESCFENCLALEEITLPKELTTIEERAFYGCECLKTITIPSNVTYIGEFAFCGCSSLVTITLPKSVANVGDFAFDDCTNLTHFKVLNKDCTLGEAAEFNARVHGYSNSTAEDFADTYGLKFKAIEDI